jgi:hypothetical protein
MQQVRNLVLVLKSVECEADFARFDFLLDDFMFFGVLFFIPIHYILPGHFFNIEHSPYLFHMFSFKKHRLMHVCNHVTKVTKIST